MSVDINTFQANVEYFKSFLLDPRSTGRLFMVNIDQALKLVTVNYCEFSLAVANWARRKKVGMAFTYAYSYFDEGITIKMTLNGRTVEMARPYSVVADTPNPTRFLEQLLFAHAVRECIPEFQRIYLDSEIQYKDVPAATPPRSVPQQAREEVKAAPHQPTGETRPILQQPAKAAAESVSVQLSADDEEEILPVQPPKTRKRRTKQEIAAAQGPAKAEEIKTGFDEFSEALGDEIAPDEMQDQKPVLDHKKCVADLLSNNGSALKTLISDRLDMDHGEVIRIIKNDLQQFCKDDIERYVKLEALMKAPTLARPDYRRIMRGTA